MGDANPTVIVVGGGVGGGDGSNNGPSSSSSSSSSSPKPKRARRQHVVEPAERDVKLESLTPEEANKIIHSHRKVRYGTACWPCRQRKVKCDNQSPCDNCVRRNHVALCSYKPSRPSSASVSATPVSAGRKRPPSSEPAGDRDRDGPDAKKSDDGRRKDSWPRGLARLDDSDGVEVPRYLGQNSIPMLLREQASANDRNEGTDVRSEVQAIFGVDTSAPFPLMSPRHLEKLASDLAAELPSDRDVIRLFRTYKEIPQPFWGFVIDMDDLESRLLVYLEERSRNAAAGARTFRPVSASWLAILFAVLAVGSQYHEGPWDVRTRDSQKFIHISFHFLRAANFLLRPTLDAIQALLLTCFALINDMKAEVAWALLGLTCRLAQSLGLHRPCREVYRDCREGATPDPRSEEMVRRRLWWTCVWHDVLVSLSFDRAPMSSFAQCPIPMRPEAATEGWSYLEYMYRLVNIISSRLGPDTVATATYADIIETCGIVEDLGGSLAERLRDGDRCRTAVDRLQRFAARLHGAFVISVACRPALRRECGFAPDQKRELADRCTASLIETVRMFLAMHQLSSIPTRTWAFTYHGLSSALLLAILPEARSDPEVRRLQGALMAALSATAARDRAADMGVGGATSGATSGAFGAPPTATDPRAGRDIELSGPLSRALTALKNIYDHGSISGSVKGSGGGGGGGVAVGPSVADAGFSGNKSPVAAPASNVAGAQLLTAVANSAHHLRPAQMDGHCGHGDDGIVGGPTGGVAGGGVAGGVVGGVVGGGDPHQNAALAMAEMQNGASLSETSSAMPYVTDGLNAIMTAQGIVGPDLAYLSPLDVYESIWWEPSNPWNNNGLGVNFDYMAQPPPGQDNGNGGRFYL